MDKSFRNYYKGVELMLDTIINKIKEIDKEHLVIAIDGKAASGKTTLANLLKEKLDAFLKAKYADGTMTALLAKYQVSLNTAALA